MMKRITLRLIEKLARDVRRGDAMCDYDPVFMDLFGSLFLELAQCLAIIPYLEATPTRHPEGFADTREIRYLKSFWLKTDPFEDEDHCPFTGRWDAIYDDMGCGGQDAPEHPGQDIHTDKEEDDDLPF